MKLWYMDVVGGIGLADGSELTALTGIDDGRARASHSANRRQ
jgi:hypothetical protein